jgi:hypothetical protein
MASWYPDQTASGGLSASARVRGCFVVDGKGISHAMRICWSDLDNVQSAGTYPFRDGLITVTFAELAVWKTAPNTAFRLMRKHPIISGAPHYVLGEQTAPEPASDRLFYKSSNGDCWSLVRNPTTGGLMVTHTPNVASGGNVTHADVETFLTTDAHGPEHQALRRLLEKASNATILIAYDIHSTTDAAYDDLVAAIHSLGAWWHHLETVWIVRSERTPDEIREQLQRYIGSDDQLLVLDVTGDRTGWTGINAVGSEWLGEYVVRGDNLSPFPV